jgi:hypothetical protein
MRLNVSTPVQLILAATVAGSIVLLLRPEPEELSLPVFQPKSTATAGPLAASDSERRESRSWNRPQVSEPTASKVAAVNKSGIPPLPPAGATADASPTPPLPPLPAALNSPDVIYLGRMIQDGKEQVFFSSNGEAVVLGMGDVLNNNWRIQSISPTSIELHHVRTDETRLIATGGSGAALPVGKAPGQVGQAFLRSAPSNDTSPNNRTTNE